MAYSDEKCLYYQILTTTLIRFSIKGWENVLFELGSEGVNDIVHELYVSDKVRWFVVQFEYPLCDCQSCVITFCVFLSLWL